MRSLWHWLTGAVHFRINPEPPVFVPDNRSKSRRPSMRIRRPSPGTVISIIALVMATTGTAVAAVDFARNAGAVDRLSAVPASASNSRAKGNLVATARGGSNVGQIPNKFLADVPETRAFAVPLAVEDNATGGAVDVS